MLSQREGGSETCLLRYNFDGCITTFQHPLCMS